MDTTHDEEKPNGLSRRSALGLLGSFGAGAASIPMLSATPAAAETGFDAPAFISTPDTGGASPVQGLHLTFGADPSTQMVVSWITDGRVKRPRVMYGTLEHGFGSHADATTLTYVDGKSGRTVYVHHAQLNRLKPGTEYVYMVSHDGAAPRTRRTMT
ncbi:fibronectin type III domain-containing protein [Planotetraspora silvatica]|uniref:fibronectin type III domain-containing protein n=1 Tax=Planotetraspora silvatica TaxID=234614 RepID=UPI001EF1B8CC|nr:fibronectin type III domain-containing protein [Planotetraspora silvatica]